ncbi:enoyl-CoA hydratase/isomerase family protein [Bordetella bronchiseptica]|uniref:Carnitinyl-CoA dehydratase n=2 Tax=Bordetella bronchiseptica TaxID=518 RepID=A0ABR4RE80_BORBO|nr:enoyl-CoA hydratase-related protein [Bordetella bronchiseptica]SHS35777.1 carnitinyl-CoA dehydratase [Mycobacteroides abscessus subsp. abscessus]AWP75204.1 enoyl-CoA hydratase [Bordetella bronchiseptica]AZW12717.1 enoyl-CoA hydratase [Bordetella bronchiseptica]AZW21974.1 enoyl-CoA hydratase [Bordetella bronchiseptica]KCV34322.1 putative carnitinyl-CoA dehydratase [Bordetella bronchiseptica 00-P-2796]
MNTSPTVRFETREQIAIITLNRPDKRNAINLEMRQALIAAWERFENDAALRVAILTGAGERSFSAGRDLSENTDLSQKTFLPILGDNVQASKPVIAAVNGAALGGGWFFTQMCDLVVAADHAVFGMPESKVGRAPAWAVWLQGVIPQKLVLELLLTGNSIGAQRAAEIGFVNHVVPAAQLMDKAMELARAIVATAPLSAAACKEMVYAAAEMGRGAALRTAFHILEPLYRSEDAREGALAFREKRAPRWSGR